MGIFDRFKRNRENAEASEIRIPAEKNESSENKEFANEACANDNRRFTFLVEDTFELKNDAGVVVVGTVRGTVKVNDAVYILHPGNRITLSTVSSMEQKTDGQMKKCSTATNTPVSILISDCKDKSQIQKYSVLTSIRPQPAVDVNKAVENPYVLALSYEYERFQGNTEYLNILIYEIVHAHYLVPVFMKNAPKPDGDGKAVFSEGTTISFPSLAHPADAEKSVFPVFTDWEALNQWTHIFDENHPAQTMIFQFPDCTTFATDQNAGMVINPFSNTPLFLSDSMIASIKSMEGYQREFIQQEGEQVKQIKVEKEMKILLGVPKNSNEVRLIREAMIEYGKKNAFIDAVYLLLKMDEKNEKVYLCVVDCPEEEARNSYRALYHEIKPFASEIPVFEFAGRNDIADLKNCLTEEALVYKKA